MNRQQHMRQHAQVVEALGGRPRQPQQVVYREGNTSQINPRRNPRSNFRDRSNRRKTTGFEEIRQEYYQLHHNKAREEPAEPAGQGTATVHRGQSVDDTQEFFPKPSAFIRAPRRQVPPRRASPADMEDDELTGGQANFRTRGSKAADMFQRRRERTDQFILDQENASPTPAAHQAPIQIQLAPNVPPKKQPPRPQQPRRQPPVIQPQQHHQPQHYPQHQQPPQRHHPQPHHQQYQQSHQNRQQYQQPQPQMHRPQPQAHRPQQQTHRPQQQTHRPQQQQHRQDHTVVDSRRTRQPLAPKSPRFEPNSPWNDRNMQVGKRFHPNVIPYQDNYNTSPRGWGRSDLGDDNNVKHDYEFTETSQKYSFTPAPRLNHFGSGMKPPQNENYNSRPKSWGDMDSISFAHPPPPSRRAFPSTGRQHGQSSANQFAGQSGGWGYGESDEL